MAKNFKKVLNSEIMKIEIKRASLYQAKEIAEVCVITWKHAYRGIVSDEFLDAMTPDRHERIIKENLERGLEDIFVAVYKEKIIGFVSVNKAGSEGYDAEIVAIYVLPEYQGCGTGKMLFTQALQAVESAGLNSVILWVLEDNSAVNFYRHLGGVVRKRSTKRIGNQTLNILGFVWEDL